MERKAIMKVTFWIMTVFAYLIFSVLFWQKAWAGPLDEAKVGEDLITSIGFLSDNYEELAGKYTLIVAIGAAASGQATGWCTIDGEIDWSCKSAMHGIINEAIAWHAAQVTGKRTLNAVVDAFWDMCGTMQADDSFDRSWSTGEVVDMFVAVALSLYRQEHKEGGS